MTIKGQIGSISHDDDRAQAGEPVIVMAGAVKADQGELPIGLVLTEDVNGEMIPYEEIAAEVLDTGDGTATAMSGTLVKGPVEPGSVVVTDGVETFADDGLGRLTGDAGGSGTVNYATGAASATFNAAPGNGVSVTVDYATAIDGVLDEIADTANTDSAVFVKWGLVRRDVLKVGAVAKAAASATLLKRMIKRGFFAR